MAKAGWVTLGEVTKVRGLEGEIVVLPWSDKSERWAQLKEVFLGEENPQGFLVKRARIHQGKVLLQLAGIQTPQQAQAWVGSPVQRPAGQLPALAEAEYYAHDLAGLEVFTEESEYLGQIKEIIQNPGNDILQVRGDKREFYIPGTKAAVVKVDLEKKKVIVNKKLLVEH